jgi:hypothetical protein
VKTKREQASTEHTPKTDFSPKMPDFSENFFWGGGIKFRV